MARFDSLHRRLAALALFAAGAATGAMLLPAVGVQAGPFAGGGADLDQGSRVILVQDLAAIQNFAAALETRVAALEDHLLPHISAEGLTPPMQGGVVLKAPFTIVNASNQAIFSIDADGAGAKLILGDATANRHVELSSGAESNLVAVHNGESNARIEASGSNAYFDAVGPNGGTALGQSEFGFGLFINSQNGEPMADLSQPEGKGMALRIYNQGASAAQIGTAPGLGGLLRLFGSGDKLAVALDTMNDGTGRIHVSGDTEANGVTLDGKAQAVKTEGQAGIAVLGKDDTGWGVTLKDSGGNRQATLSNESGRGMGLRVYDAGVEVAGIGNMIGKGGTVQIYSTGVSEPAVSLQVNQDGSGTAHATGAGGKKGITLDGENNTIFLESDEGNLSLGGGDEAGWGVFLDDASGQPLADLSQPQGKGMALRIYAKGTYAAEIGSGPVGGALRLFASDGDTLGVSADALGDGTGLINVRGTSDTSGVTLDGKKELVTVGGDAGTAGLGKSDVGWGLRLGDKSGKSLAELTQPSGKGMALRIFDAGTQAAAIGTLPGEGGQIRLYGKGTLAVSMGAVGADGAVTAYKAGQQAAALLGGDNMVTVFNGSGQAVSMLMLAQSGPGGKVQATDPGGSPVFKAGYLPDGPGGACVAYKGVKCLGIGLTGMEGFR